MSTPNPITDPLTLLAASLITLGTGEYIEQASGQPAQLARAQAILTIASSLQQLNAGNTGGLAGLQTSFLALVKTISDEAVQLAFNGLLAAVLTKAASFTASGSLLAKVGGFAASQALAVIAQTAQTYVTELTPAAA